MSSTIDEQNGKFLINLKGDECIRVDEKGRLYAVKGFVSNIFHRYVSDSGMNNIEQVVEKALLEYFKQRKIEGLKSTRPSGSNRYEAMYKALETSSILSEKNKKLILNTFYEKRYQSLLKQGKPPFECEAIVIMEMYHDPNIPRGIKVKIKPELAKAGVNGTYFLKNREGEKIAVFKPFDEEAEMPNNPRGIDGDYNPQKPTRHTAFKGHIKGTAWKKEVAASNVDRTGITGVPKTVRTQLPFFQKKGASEVVQKVGSLQKFVIGKSLEQLDSDEITKLPDKEIHKMAALDLIIGMGDRNPGNVLWTGKQIIPIDHGISYLDTLDWREEGGVRSDMRCVWYYFPQVNKVFHPEIAKWVLSLDPLEEAHRLRSEVDMPESSIRESMLRLMVFQKGLKKGLTVKKIAASLMAVEMDCLIERCCNQAVSECEKHSDQWGKLKGPQRERKRFDIYYKIVENLVNKELNKGI